MTTSKHMTTTTLAIRHRVGDDTTQGNGRKRTDPVERTGRKKEDTSNRSS